MTATQTLTAETWTAWHRSLRRERWRAVFTAASEAEASQWTLRSGLGGDSYVGRSGIDPNDRRPPGGKGQGSTR
jgi:hypothetical protein